ncbi:hypothetical protein GOP47_0012403 [Adiantum capillus-veneris]|uniref:Pectate lyase n=1 Tax=Adiantum capillus-veneris TaxID=13818 RepID=A0A9D4URP3_ADICA|nr:hypothetical protein GOP47_0012403 [Adiantum capillus-veneris]
MDFCNAALLSTLLISMASFALAGSDILQWNTSCSTAPGTNAAAAATINFNIIDKCWRGDSSWARNRMKLADCAIGFGSKAYGGKGGQYYVVTDDGDDAQNPTPGTLRYGIIQLRPLWITFARDMTITLQNELIFTSDKTIDGRGANVHIAYGPCLTVQYVSNVIIHGIHLHNCQPGHSGRVRSSTEHIGYRGGSDGDAINIFGSHDIWIDHNTLSSSTDGLIDVIHASTAVTVSNNYFSDHDKVMLFGHDDSYSADKGMRVTVAFNYFGPGLVQRMPRCRLGYVHVLNNDYDGWGEYALGGSAGPTIISEGNRFRASSSAKQVTKRDCKSCAWQGWRWTSDGDTFLEGAYFVQSGPGVDAKTQIDLSTGAGTFKPFFTAAAGALECAEGGAC